MSSLAPRCGQRGSFISKVPLPDAEPDDAATFTVTLSRAWRPVMLGALMQLVQPSSWDTTDANALALVLARSLKLIDIVAQAGDGENVESGSTTVTIYAGAAAGSAEQIYPTAYSVAPDVVAGSDSGDYIASADTVSATSFRAVLTAPTPVLADVTATVTWFSKVAS
jgi:hypothetical protein